MAACSNKKCANYRLSQTVKMWNGINGNCKITIGGTVLVVRLLTKELREKIEKTIMEDHEMSKLYFADVQVGDRVTDIIFSKSGIVKNVDMDNPYPIFVDFDDGKHASYRLDGKHFIGDLSQRLYWHGATVSVVGDTPPVREPVFEMCRVCHKNDVIIDDGGCFSAVRCRTCSRNTGNFWVKDYNGVAEESIESFRRFTNPCLAAINEWNRMNGK